MRDYQWQERGRETIVGDQSASNKRFQLAAFKLWLGRKQKYRFEAH